MAMRKLILMLVASFVGISAVAATQAADDQRAFERVRQMSHHQDYITMKEMESLRPGSVSIDELQALSLEMLNEDLKLSKSRSESVKSASEYLEREGFTVTKKGS